MLAHISKETFGNHNQGQDTFVHSQQNRNYSHRYKSTQEESDILKGELYYLIPRGKYHKKDVFFNFKKIYHLKLKE